MSLPTSKPAQPSIRSFFQSKPPKYAPPPPKNDDNKQTTSIPLDPPPKGPPPTSNPVTIPPLPTTLPREASIRLVTTDDINPLRRINSLLLPVPYQDDFYKGATDPSTFGNTSRVITWAHEGESAKIVGGVVARLEPIHAGSSSQTLYIRSLCLLSPYRSFGLIGSAVDNIIATALSDPNADVKTVSAHVWTENEEGLHWYDAQGFKRDSQPINGYYRKLRPDTAWLVQRDASARTPAPKSKSNSDSSAPPMSTATSPRPSPTAAAVNLPPMGGPPKGIATPPTRSTSGQSFMDKRADMEWNDLPADMAPDLLVPPKGPSEPGSTTSSRSSSAVRKKRDRSYPAAAFGAGA